MIKYYVRFWVPAKVVDYYVLFQKICHRTYESYLQELTKFYMSLEL